MSSRMLLLLVFALLTSTIVHAEPERATATHSQANDPLVLTSLEQVHNRLRKNDTKDYLIDLEASVNFWDRSWGSLFVQDGDVAVFVEMPLQVYSRIHDLKLGDVVHIKGTFNPVRYVLHANSLEMIASDEPAQPMAFEIASAKLGSYWSRRARVQGTIESVLVGFSHLQLVVRARSRRFFVLAKVAPNRVVPQAGDVVSLTGTLSSLVDANDSAYVYLVHQMPGDETDFLSRAQEQPAATSIDDYSVLLQAPQPEPQAPQPESTASPNACTLYEVQGQVTYIQNYEFVILENSQGQSLLVYAPFFNDLRVGDMVRITGVRPQSTPPDSIDREPLRPGHDSLGETTHLIAYRVVVATTAPVNPAPSMSVVQLIDHRYDRVRAEVNAPYLSSQQVGDFWHVVLGDKAHQITCEIPVHVFDPAKLNFKRASQVHAAGIVFPPATPSDNYLLRVNQLGDLRVIQEIAGIDPKTAALVLSGMLFFIIASVTLLRLQVRRKEHALACLGTQLESSYEAISEGLLMVDDKGVIVGANPRLNELPGLDPEELRRASGSLDEVGRTIAKRFQGSEFWEFWQGTDPPTRIVEYREFQTVDPQPRTIIAKTTRIHDAYGMLDGRIWTFDDVSSQTRLKTNLLQAQKMETVGRLLGGVAHDFNNLLGVMQSNLELLHMHRDLCKPEAYEYIDAADQAIGYATNITKNLLGFSRQSSLQMQVCDINQVVEKMCLLLKFSLHSKNANAHYDVELDLASDLMTCLIDENQIVQVLLNICFNARDAMEPQGGTIHISTANVTLDELGESPLVVQSHTGKRSSSYVRIRVEDSGHGIPLELQAKIFEPLFTTKPIGEGTGFGLATAKGIVSQLEGDILCESQVNHGSRFDVILPAYQTVKLPKPSTTTHLQPEPKPSP